MCTNMSTQSRLISETYDGTQVPQQYLTVSQAAKLLSVHPSTIRRWIDQGRLPAYRLGPKRIGVRAVDLAGLVAPRPVRGETGRGVDKGERITVRPLSDKEQQQLFAAVEAARRHQAELLAQRRGEPFADSTEVIREAREERTRELMRALDE
jgi:excisionase family DNA binding protein